MLTHESHVKEFTWLNKLGVYGVKVDFFESDNFTVTNTSTIDAHWLPRGGFAALIQPLQ